jgi:prevent-host-death family protein
VPEKSRLSDYLTVRFFFCLPARSTACLLIELQLKLYTMKTVTMLEFRRNAEGVLRRIGKGERLVLSHRGKPAARLVPLDSGQLHDPDNDPFLSIVSRAKPSPKGKTKHTDIDRILYGRS